VRVLYDEDVASHIDPESCDAVHEGRYRSVDRGACRPAIEPRQPVQRSADVFELHGRQYGRGRDREPSSGLRVVEDPGMHGSSLLGNREISRLTAQRIGRPASGRPEGRSR
jgi:hypothetical protein